MAGIDAYRQAVVHTVPCPLCAAQRGQQCWHFEQGAPVRTTVVPYVHDDRSYAHWVHFVKNPDAVLVRQVTRED